jgi:hypothetical protein
VSWRRIAVIVLAVLLVAGVASKWALLLRGVPLKNDHVQQALIYHDLLENRDCLLRSWSLTANNYLFTDIPVYFLVGALFGWSSVTIKAGSFLIVALIALLMFFILKRSFGGLPALGALAVFYVLPQKGIFIPNFHVGVIMLALASLLVLAWSMEGSARWRGRRGTATSGALLFVLSTLAVYSDALYIVVFTAPAFLAVAAYRLRFGHYPLDRRRLFMVGTFILGGSALGMVLIVNSALFAFKPAFAAAIATVPLREVPRMFLYTLGDIARLFHMSTGPSQGAWSGVAMMANIIIFTVTAIRGVLFLRRGKPGPSSLILYFFACTAGLLVAAYTLSVTKQFYYLNSLFVVYSVFLGLAMADILGGRRKIMAACLFVLLALSASHTAYTDFTTVNPQRKAGLAQFLARKGLSYGYASLENSHLITFLTRQKVRVRPVYVRDDVMTPYIWQARFDWYLGSAWRGPTFLIVEDGEGGRFGFDRLTPEAIGGMFGAPTHVMRYESWRVMVWDYNIIHKYWERRGRGPGPP